MKAVLLLIPASLLLTQCVPLMLAQSAVSTGKTLTSARSLTGAPKKSPPPKAGPPPPPSTAGHYTPASYHPSQPAVPQLSLWEESTWSGWYGEELHGRLTANGEVYNMNDWTAAHPSLPFGTFIRVTNLYNSRFVDLRVNDRCGGAHGGLGVGVSRMAAWHLDMLQPGVVPVSIRGWE